jgi:predicted acylesterase/phospholipase RssA
LKGVSAALALATALAGCGAGILRNPVPEALAASAQPFGREGLRDWGDGLDGADVDARIAERQAFLKAQFGPEIAAGRRPRLTYLALSGGGQWGAFGAGILEAWSRSGTRPEFQGVAGVSTGAIIAPFAFLGPAYDATLREIYTQYSTEDLIETTLFSGIISGASLTDTTRLRQVIARYVTPELLEAIAAEHRKGRILHIGTTNLDAGRPVIWNVGAIAASGEPGALELVRELIRASAAIPVAFPPIFVPVQTPDGRVFDEMHVDGGASSQVTFVSPALPIGELTRRTLGRNLDRDVYVIVNNNLVPPYQSLRPRVAAIGGAAVSSLIRGSAIGDVYRLHAIAQRDGIGFHVTAVPAEVPCPEPTEDFDRAFMQCLFDFGGRLFDSGGLWSDAPPFFATHLPD